MVIRAWWGECYDRWCCVPERWWRGRVDGPREGGDSWKSERVCVREFVAATRVCLLVRVCMRMSFSKCVWVRRDKRDWFLPEKVEGMADIRRERVGGQRNVVKVGGRREGRRTGFTEGVRAAVGWYAMGW